MRGIYDDASVMSMTTECRFSPLVPPANAKRMADPRLLGVGDRLVRFRIVRGFETRGALAALLWLNEDTLGTYEGGRTVPPPHVLVRLADLLDCTVDYLLTGNPRGMARETLAALEAVTPEQIAAALRTGPKRRGRRPAP
jgi:transcriptional regulator with XRE-family HTH domain